MMEQELQMIKERAEKATPGPWIIEESCFGNFNAASENESYDLPACLMNNADAQFVTNAREDIPALIAEVERLRGVILETKGDILSISSVINTALGYGETVDLENLDQKLHEIFLRMSGDSDVI